MTYEERLADYVAGTLVPEEHQLVETELARDPKLRHALAAMQRADTALRQLDAPVLPPGFDERLHAAIAPELDRQLGPKSATVLSFRQRLASSPRWLSSVAAAAAGVFVIAGIGLTATNLLGSSNGDDVAAFDVEADHGGVEADDPVASLAMPESAPALGPIVVITDRTVSPDILDDISVMPELDAIAAQQLSLAEGQQRATEYQSLLADAADGSEPRALTEPGAIEDAREATHDDALVACLDPLLGEPPAIVGYVEQAVTDRGAVVLIYGLITAPHGTYDTVEVIAVERDGCAPIDMSGTANR